MQVKTINVMKNLLVKNDELAAVNRQRFQEADVLAINLIAGPGAGKTSLIQKTLQTLPELRFGVIEGDIASSIDTEKVLLAGARDAVQINTRGTCHLEAGMVAQALEQLELNTLDVVFIENVGNLICPTSWDLGESLKICLVGTSEGDDKAIKYPSIFARSDAIVLNKIDLIDFVDFDRSRFYSTLQALNSNAPVFELSCRSGQGLVLWAAWLGLHKAKEGPYVQAHSGTHKPTE
jgi:hydrogenase nickel incorporation protein HypB